MALQSNVQHSDNTRSYYCTGEMLFSWLLPCSVLAQGTERPGCSGDVTQHGARDRMRPWGTLWTKTGRVSFQMQPLPRNSPVTGDINRGENKLLFSEREG